MDRQAIEPLEAVVIEKGAFAHSFKNGKIENQFSIQDVGSMSCTIQLYSWVTGLPTDKKKVTHQWVFENCEIYENESAWKSAGDELIWGAL
jgi:hypothetical protein